MKKLLVVLLVLTMLCALSAVSFGLTTPSVSKGHGVLTAAFVSGGAGSFLIGGEYGFTPDFAVGAQLGNNTTKLDVKYELNSSLALVGGIISASGGGLNPFIGVNGGASINKKLMIIGELDAGMVGSAFILLYEGGAKYNITKQLDIRGGILGSMGSGTSVTSFELGVGYKF